MNAERRQPVQQHPERAAARRRASSTERTTRRSWWRESDQIDDRRPAQAAAIAEPARPRVAPGEPVSSSIAAWERAFLASTQRSQERRKPSPHPIPRGREWRLVPALFALLFVGLLIYVLLWAAM